MVVLEKSLFVFVCENRLNFVVFFVIIAFDWAEI